MCCLEGIYRQRLMIRMSLNAFKYGIVRICSSFVTTSLRKIAFGKI
jgi:hypothetical protein